MNRLKSAVLFVAVMIAGVTSAFAAPSQLELSVTPVLTPVSHSKSSNPRDSFAAYQVTIKNNGAMATNVRFWAWTQVVGAAQTAPFTESTDVLPCRNVFFPNLIRCSVGFITGASSKTFKVAFGAPLRGSAIVLRGVALAGPNESNTEWALATCGSRHVVCASVVLLKPDSSNADSLSSFVPANGGTFFTGNNGIPSAADVHATKVVIPPTTPTTITIQETSTPAPSYEGFCFNPDENSGTVVNCWRSQITIPGALFENTPFLKVVISQDISNIQQICGEGCYTPSPSDIDIWYLPDSPYEGPWIRTQQCTGEPPAPQVPEVGPDVPCKLSSEVIPSEGSPTRYVWTLLGRRNGGYGPK